MSLQSELPGNGWVLLFEVTVLVSMGTGLCISHAVTSLSLSKINVEPFFLIP